MDRRCFKFNKYNYCNSCNPYFNLPPFSFNPSPQCINCPPGPIDPQDEQGEIDETIAFADFYALMLPDNANMVAPGTDVSFPQDGPNSDLTITPLSGGTRPVSAHLVITKLQ